MKLPVEYERLADGDYVIRRREADREGTYRYQTVGGFWRGSRDPSRDTNFCRYDEHGANLFLVGYQQARQDVGDALGMMP